MKRRIGLICLAFVLGAFRLDAAEVEGWAVRICKSNTEAPSVKLYVGVPADTNSVIYWTTWTSSQLDVIAVPSKFKDVKAILVRGESDPPRTSVHICLEYEGKTTKKFLFHGEGEIDAKQDDRADCGCEPPKK